jgi:hypothetical protein
MALKIPASAKRYWLAMNASAVDATVHSYVLISGVALVHVASDAVPAFNLQQCASMFLLTFGRAILSYLSAHPISQLLPPPQIQEHTQS